MNRRTPAWTLAAATTLALSATLGAATPTPTPTSSPSGKPSPTPSGSPSGKPSSTASPTQSDGTLQILTYRGYAEYGGTSPKANWTGDFEKDTGCRIARLDTVQTSAEMTKRTTERPYDLISASPDLAGDLIATKQVQPIDPAKIADLGDVPRRFRDMTTQAGKLYGVPYLWGYHEFLYDSSKIKRPSLEGVFDSSRVALPNSPMTIADAALADPSVTKPFALTKTQLDDAAALLGQYKDRTYWTNALDLVKGFATGSLDYAEATPYYRLLLRQAGLPVKALDAKQATGWVDSWMLGATTGNTPNLDCAYRWLNWMAAPDAQRDAAAWMGLAPANVMACKGKAKQTCEAYGVDKPNRLERVAFAVRPPGGCQPQDRECTDYKAWQEKWLGLAR